MPKRKSKPGGAKKGMGPGMTRHPKVQGGPIAPNPGSLLGAGISMARAAMTSGVKVPGMPSRIPRPAGDYRGVIGENLRNAGETTLTTTGRVTRDELDRQGRARQQARHEQQVDIQTRTRRAQGAKPEGPARPAGLPRDTSKKPTTFKVSSAKPPSTRARRPGMRAE